MRKQIAICLAGAAAVCWFFPGYNGALFEPSNISVGDSRIIAAILAVGAAVLWAMPDRPKA